ncbi:MAG: aminotransferase class III-fold pyridoxal phosphate-dependent enzyme [Verrucomicrobia bacterium]|nr:aminotransferase class III-fold pyridoxal phosphate-dependent enzyme [Verrucomicrobiota bacterium]
MRTTSKSLAIFQESEKYLVGGTSTGSKRVSFSPDEPAVIVKGKGCRVWDADGNEYIDFRNSLGPVTLGYGFKPINDAIKEQLDNGIIFGHPHPLEGEVAKLLCENIPCADQVRFLKTGGEACSAAIKVARAATGRDKIIQIGYNGWLNSVGEGASVLPRQQAGGIPLGVPRAVSELFYVATWNDRAAVEQIFSNHHGDIAAVIVACGYPDIEAGHTFLPFIREITEKYGALMILDEIVTGFRLAIGGAQEYFNVTPDLAVFAKGMANGMPISTYLGKSKYMQLLSKCIVSSTYGGETLSLAAAKAAIETYKRENVVGHLWKVGQKMWDGAEEIMKRHGVAVTFKGAAPCKIAVAETPELHERLFRAAYRNGLSFYNANYVNFSHKSGDIDEALERLEKAVREL